MQVRLATLNDISDILAFGKDAMARSNYSVFPFNAVVARRIVKQSMTSADSRVWIACRDNGVITGFLMGELGPMPMTHFHAATDLIFVADAGGDLLLDAFVEWCKMRHVARIDMGISAGPEREAAVRKMFESRGFVYSGPMFHLNMLPEGGSP